jgi:hypothetical protein
MPQKDIVPSRTPIVAIVVDPEFGERLLSLADEMAVWIADTPANRSCAEALWSSTAGVARNAVTTFKVDLGKTGEDWCLNILPQVALHHGQHSQSPAYSVLDVIGAHLTPELRDTLAEYGLTSCAERSGGFRATRSSAAA